MRILWFIVVAMVVLGQGFEAVPPPSRKCPVQMRCCTGKACAMGRMNGRNCGVGSPTVSIERAVRKLDLPLERCNGFSFRVVSESITAVDSQPSSGFPRIPEQPPRSVLVTA